MKYFKIIRILGVALIFSLLIMVMPALPVSAVTYTVTLSPTSGKIGNTVTITGVYSPAPVSETWAYSYFSPNDIAVNQLIASATTRELVSVNQIIDTSVDTTYAGNFTGTFTVPSVLNDGTITQNVTSGTYYVYTTILTSSESVIRAKAAFTVTVPTLDTPSPASGPPGTSVMLTGSNFPVSTELAVTFDTSTIPIDSGHTSTLSTGLFLSYITIPTTATVGAHTITVTAGTGTASAAFTVTASPTLDTPIPSSGCAGTAATITGTNFPASTALSFTFDTTPLTPTSGDAATRSSGIFITVLTIPTSATAGAHSITATAGGLSASTTFTVTASTTTPTLNALNPASGPAGTNVAISGSGFAASTTLTFSFNTTSLTPTGSTATGADGSFSSVIVIPSTATAGTYTLTVTAGATSATASFTVTQSSTTTPATTTLPLIIDQTGNTVGSTISIAGSGFLADHAVAVSLDDTPIKEVNTNASGGFVSNFLIPPNSEHGEHTITASDGTNIATATFTVESTAPDTPIPLLPGMGEAVSPPASFDWADVEDDSAPVTYNLQIATTNTFDANAILLNLTGITESQYTLTEDEQKVLSSEITYYWREQAVDAALNESGWTGANEFSMIKPFEFTGWPLYLTISLGGLVLFLLGLWVGRRTAFYY